MIKKQTEIWKCDLCGEQFVLQTFPEGSLLKAKVQGKDRYIAHDTAHRLKGQAYSWIIHTVKEGKDEEKGR